MEPARLGPVLFCAAFPAERLASADLTSAFGACWRVCAADGSAGAGVGGGAAVVSVELRVGTGAIAAAAAARYPAGSAAPFRTSNPASS